MRTSYSCQSCAKRKRKCDLAKPSCSRCAKLKQTCVWPAAARHDPGALDLYTHRGPLLQMQQGNTALTAGGHGHGRELYRTEVQGHFMGDLWWPMPNGPVQPLQPLVPSSFQALGARQRLQVEDILCTPDVMHLQEDELAWLTQSEPEPSRTTTVVVDLDPGQAHPNPIDALGSFSDTDEQTFTSGDEGADSTWSPFSSPREATTSLIPSRASSPTPLFRPVIQRREVCIDIFFTYFCTNMGMLASTLAWKQLLPSLMSSSDGVCNAVAAVGGLYAHRMEGSTPRPTDAMTYYAASVKALQRALTPAVIKQKSNSLSKQASIVPDSGAMVGMAILMIFELVSGNRIGYVAHVNALSQMLRQLGPAQCRTGLNALLFATLMKPEQDCALIGNRDTFLADDAWLALAAEQFPAAVSKFCGLFAVAARVMARENAFKKQVLDCHAAGMAPSPDLPLLRAENEARAKVCLSTLKESLATVEQMGLFAESPDDGLMPCLAKSPFLPSIRAKHLRLTGFYPMMIACIVKLEACFNGFNSKTALLVRKCIMLSQDVICRGFELGIVVRQITPLALVGGFLVEPKEKAWVKTLWSMLRAQGLANLQ